MSKDRLEDIDNWLKSNYKSQNDYLLKLKKKERKWREKYTEELSEYVFIPTKEDLLEHVKKGGYIRYINLKGELRWGGILVSTFQGKKSLKMILQNKTYKRWIISWNKNYIFYRPHRTSSDKLRELFIEIAGIK